MSSHEQAPVCGNCMSGMSPREGNRWFCPRCADYGEYVGTIQPDTPAHPGFKHALREDPELAVGWGVEYLDQVTDETEYFGKVAEYHEEEESYLVTTDMEHPFEETHRFLDRDELMNLYHGSDRRRPPNGDAIFLV